MSPEEEAAVQAHDQAANEALLLTDAEVAKLAARAEEPADDVVGGALTNQQLTYVVIALSAAVVVLIFK